MTAQETEQANVLLFINFVEIMNIITERQCIIVSWHKRRLYLLLVLVPRAMETIPLQINSCRQQFQGL